jgi:hypothetical protein
MAVQVALEVHNPWKRARLESGCAGCVVTMKTRPARARTTAGAAALAAVIGVGGFTIAAAAARS